MMKINLTPEKLKSIMADYEFDYDSPEYDDDDLKLFKAIDNLDLSDKIIFILYTHLQSLRKTASVLNISYTTTRKYINELKKRILECI